MYVCCLIRCRDEKFEAVRRYNPNAKLVTVEDASHLLMFEKEEEFLKFVRKFLA